MHEQINLNEFLFRYDQVKTPAITNSDNDTILFLDDEYTNVLLRVELKEGKLSFILTNNINFNDFNIKISRLSEFEYEIIPVSNE